MYLQLFNVLTVVTLALAQAPAPSGRPAPAPPPPVDAPPNAAPLTPRAPVSVRAFNPIVSMIQSGLNDPALTPSPANPIISLLQSGIRNPATTPNPIVSMIQSGIKPPTTYTKEPTSFALSNIDFGSTLVQSPKPTTNPIDPDSTPGEVRFCSSAAYTSWNGDEENAVCDSITTDLGSCRNLGAALRGKVASARPDKGQLCLLFDDADCYGSAEWVKWPGVQNLRGRIGDGGGAANRVVSFRCTAEG